MPWRAVGAVIKVLVHLSGTLMGWTALQALANRIAWEKSSFFSLLSSCSIPMYLFHQTEAPEGDGLSYRGKDQQEPLKG